MISTKAVYRAAAVVLVLFAAGHTAGFLSFVPAEPEGRAVLESMQRVTFQLGGHAYTYGGFYRGFGLTATVFFLFSALVAWQIGGLPASTRRSLKGTAWGLAVAHAANAVVCFAWFFTAPAVFSLVTVALLVIGAMRLEHQQ